MTLAMVVFTLMMVMDVMTMLAHAIWSGPLFDVLVRLCVRLVPCRATRGQGDKVTTDVMQSDKEGKATR